MKITLLVPTLNEIDGMKEIMPRVKPEWIDQILVIDGQSTDGTVEYAREQGYDVVIQKKMGMRHAYMECLPHIKGDVILTMGAGSIGKASKQLFSDLQAGDET